MDLDRYFIITTKYLKILPKEQFENLMEIEATVRNIRAVVGKDEDSDYYVCKCDEPYAKSVRDMIMEGEESKKRLTPFGEEIDFSISPIEEIIEDDSIYSNMQTNFTTAKE